MRIDERVRGDLVILDLVGKITLGEGDEYLKDKINELTKSGRHRNVLVNFVDVPYIDSSGLGEIVRAYTTISRQGGMLRLLDPTKRIRDNLAITKLQTVFDIFTSDEFPDPIVTDPWAAICPVCVPDALIPLRGIPSYQRCPRCELALKVPDWREITTDDAIVDCRTVVVQTYDDESVGLLIDKAYEVTVRWRFDMFAAGSAEIIWTLLPRPRRVLFLVSHGSYSEAGLEALLTLCKRTEDGKAVVFVTGVSKENRSKIRLQPGMFIDEPDAFDALALPPEPLAPLRIRLRRVKSA